MTQQRHRPKASGGLRQLPSGSWQPSVIALDGRRVSLGSYRTRREAEQALAEARTDRSRGRWVDPRDGRITVGTYVEQWVRDRANLRPRTRELYEGLVRVHIAPVLGEHELAALTPAAVRQWHAALSRAERPGPVTVAKAYRLLRTIMNTAVEDEVIARNPCNIRGAGVERSPERPIATPAQVLAIADAVEPRYRALVLLATYGTLRFGELFGLQRRHIDLDVRRVKVEQSIAHLADGTMTVGPPKSDAGHREVSIPPAIADALRAHMDEFVSDGPDAWVFRGAKGAVPRTGNWSTMWRRVTASVGVEGLHFHDLRHTGNTMAASTGASTKELMSRMGHASSRAALLYQHATREREDQIALGLQSLLDRSMSEALPGDRA